MWAHVDQKLCPWKSKKQRQLTASQSCMHVNTDRNLSASPWWRVMLGQPPPVNLLLTYQWLPLWVQMMVLPRKGPAQIHAGLQNWQWMPPASSSAQRFRAAPEWHVTKHQRCHWWYKRTHDGLTFYCRACCFHVSGWEPTGETNHDWKPLSSLGET